MQKSYEMQDISRVSTTNDLIEGVKKICENSSENLMLLREELTNFTRKNNTKNSLDNFSDNLENMLNEYAVKVSI